MLQHGLSRYAAMVPLSWIEDNVRRLSSRVRTIYKGRPLRYRRYAATGLWLPKMKYPTSASALAISVLSHVQFILAHSWVEQLLRIAPNGTMVEPAGFIRGYVGRTDTGFTNADNTYLLPPNGRPDGKVIRTDDSLCKPSQKIGDYSDKYPRLVAAPGDYVALRYQENGHVTLTGNNPSRKPDKSGTIYVYGTASPSENETLLGVHRAWTADGQGGDRRGRLLATRHFDDGQCYQVNEGAESGSRQLRASKEAQDPQGADLWCQSDVRLPLDIPGTGFYTLYWIWDWPTVSAPGSSSVPSPETYTSCMEVRMQDRSLSRGQDMGSGFEKAQDINNRAIFDQLVNDFLVDV